MRLTCNIKTCSRKTCLETERCAEKAYKELVKSQMKKMFPTPVKDSLSQKERTIYNKTGGKCWLCNQPLSVRQFTKDHVIPKSLGGSSAIDNLMPAHKKCNGLKGSMEIKSSEEFLELFKDKIR